ncbi:MAG TPA: NAD(P)-dependent oxidoreductase [Allocoleopsis sp.]
MPHLCLIDENIRLCKVHLEQLATYADVEFIEIANASSSLFQQCHLLLLHNKLLPEQLRLMKNCRYIGLRARNLDYVPMDVADEMRITVRNIPSLSAIAVAEHTFALIFALAKNLVASHTQTVSGQWRSNTSLNFELHGKVLGIIGYGTIGRQVEQLGKCLGMQVIIADKPGTHQSNRCCLEELLPRADIVTLHLSSTASNKNYINKYRLSLMKRGSLLINTSRGSVLDYAALTEALQDGRLGGAGLDVYDVEPATSSPLFELPNVICTPHVAYSTKEALARKNDILVDQALSYLKENHQVASNSSSRVLSK